jgi:hypothetical protein
VELAQGINTKSKYKTESVEQSTFSLTLSKMRSLENAATETLEEMELEDFIEFHIHEVLPGTHYHVTFQEIANGNKRFVVSVVYPVNIGDLSDDESWEGDVELRMLERYGFAPLFAEAVMELLAITIDADYYDSDSDDESDDETLSEPRTPPPRSSRPLVPRLQLDQLV